MSGLADAQSLLPDLSPSGSETVRIAVEHDRNMIGGAVDPGAVDPKNGSWPIPFPPPRHGGSAHLLGDLGPRVSRADDEHRAVAELAGVAIVARVHLSDRQGPVVAEGGTRGT